MSDCVEGTAGSVDRLDRISGGVDKSYDGGVRALSRVVFKFMAYYGAASAHLL